MTTELSDKTITVTNPATGATIRDVPSLDREATLDLVKYLSRPASRPVWTKAGLEVAGE